MRDGFTEAEITRAKTRLLADAIYQRDSQTSLARHFGAQLTTGITLRQVIAWPDAIERVATKDVQGAMHWLDKKRSVTGYLTGEAR